MKKAAIAVSIFALITVVVLISIGNLDFASAGRSDQVTPTVEQSITAEPTESDIPVKASDQVIAEGRLIPIKFVDLSFNTSGLLAEVYVEEGDAVEAGQLLAKLSNQEQYQANIASAELELTAAQHEIKSLYDNAPLAAAEAFQALANAPEDVNDAERQVNTMTSGNVSERDIEISGVNLAFAKKKLENAQAEYQPHANKPESNLQRAAYLSKLAQAEEEYEEALRKYNSLIGAPTEDKIARAEADLVLARAQLAEAERLYEILKDGPAPDAIALAEAKLDNAEAQLAAAKAALLNLELLAPFTGTVGNSDLKVGQYIATGVPVLMLVDFSDWMVETTDLTELNVVKISEGSPAVVTCDALPDQHFPGRVSKINAIGENRQGDITYSVIIAITDYDERLLWNMTCSVAMKTD